MATYAYTFTSGDTVTPTKLNSARTVSEIVNADIKSDAAIAGSKLENGAITDAKVSASAAIALSKLANITAGRVLMGNASNAPTATALSGDVTINSSGVTAIGAGVIVNADVNASAAIAGTKISPDFGSQNIATTGTLSTGVGSVVSGSGSGDALRITQTGAGNALVVEDSTNPDSSPFVVDASGNVVVGKTTANSRLNIAATDNVITTYPLRVDNSANNYGAGYGAYGMSNRVNALNQSIDYTVDIGDDLIINTDGSERMRIDASGNVGIGGSSNNPRLQVTAERQHTSGQITGDDMILDVYNNWQSNTLGKGAILTFSDNFLSSGGVYLKTIRAAIKGGTDTIGNTGNGFLAFYTDSSTASSAEERMRITSSGNVGIGTTSPNASALLDVASTTQGFLPPRMTTAQRDAISAPPAGLMVYNTTTNKLNVRTASSWEAVTSS
jgi:hypothetical protein